MNRVERLFLALENGNPVVLDGGTGTELEKRGADMHPGAWCAMATLTAPQTLLQIHLDYIRAGARVITTNTYASSRMMLTPAGLAHHASDLVAHSSQIAVAARDEAGDDDVCVAGSLSHMIPVNADGQRDYLLVPDAATAYSYFEEMANGLAEGGVDFIILEMMHNLELAPLASRAAAQTGLPVWTGYAVVDGEGGSIVSRSRADVGVAELVAAAPPVSGQVAGVMHSAAHLVSEATQVVADAASTHLMAYPDSGHFRMPHWAFDEVMTPGELADWGVTWFGEGIGVIGGCCGLGVEHIEALANALARE
jgi:S-methylmethionine-dependent homocysteine/selenocysteine methylase